VQTKLTLRLESSTIKKAKKFAQANHTSVSDLVEDYFEKITADQGGDEIAPVVKSLSGIIDAGKISKNYRNEVTERILRKHS